MQNNVTVLERIDPHKYLHNDNIQGKTKRSRLKGFKEGRKPEKYEIINDVSGKLQIKRYTREDEIVITDLPDEITYISNGRSQCTLCNCKITTIKSIMEHVAAARHQNRLQDMKKKAPKKEEHIYAMDKEKPKNSADNQASHMNVKHVTHKNLKQKKNNVRSSNPIKLNVTCEKDGKVSGKCDPLQVFGTKNSIKHVDDKDYQGKIDILKNVEQKETKTLPNGKFHGTSNGISRELSSVANSGESGDMQLNKLSSVFMGNIDYCPMENRIGKLSNAASQLSRISHLHEETINGIFEIQGTSRFVCLVCKSSKFFFLHDILDHVMKEKHLKAQKEPLKIPQKNDFDWFFTEENESEGIINIPSKRFLFCVFCEQPLLFENRSEFHIRKINHRMNKERKILSKKKSKLEPTETFPSANSLKSFEIKTVQYVNSGRYRNDMYHSEKLGSKEIAKSFNEPLNEKSISNESASSEKLAETEVRTSSLISQGRRDSCSVDNKVSQSSTSQLNDNLDELRGKLGKQKEDIFRIDGTDIFFCIGCDTMTAFSESGIIRHLEREIHLTRKEILAYKTAKTCVEYASLTDRSQGIIQVPNKEFLFCKFCKCKITRKEMTKHVETIGHRQYVTEEITEKLKEVKLNPIEVSVPKDLLDGIEKFSRRNSLLCTKCKIDLPDESRAIEEHISTEKHKNEGIKVIFNVGKDQFECRICCALILSGYSVLINHLNGQSHAKKWKKKENQLHNFIGTLKNHPDMILNDLNSKANDIHDLELLTGDIVKIRGIDGNWCIKCNHQVPNAHVKSHKYRRQHKDALKGIQDNQDILTFHCELCNCTVIGRRNWDEHEKSNEHRRNEEELVGPKPSEVPVDESQPEAKPMISSFQLSEDDNNLEKEELIKGSPRPDAKAYPEQEQMVDCNICQCKILGGNMNISAHQDSKEHKDNEAKLFDAAKTPGNAENLVPNASASATRFDVLNTLISSYIAESSKEPAACGASKDTEDSDDESVINELPKKTVKKPQFRRKPPHAEVINSKNIYEIDRQKMSRIKSGVALSVPKDENTNYCLICHCNVSKNFQTFYEHLCSIKHLDYLRKIQNNDKLIRNYKNLFSDLALSYEYMENISSATVKCHACDILIENKFSELYEHIHSANHIDKWTVIDGNSKELFRRLQSRMERDFYSVREYWCAICNFKFTTEYAFQKHLKKRKHLKEIRKFGDQFLMFDYCGVCASLWYGLLKTFAIHSDSTMHKCNKLDEIFSIEKLPESAEFFVKWPEEGMGPIMTGLEISRRMNQHKECQLLRDLSEIVVLKYPNAIAHPFGSRITGLGGKNSDLDVFLDCPTKKSCMYFGENSHPELIKRRLLKIKESLENNTNIWHIDDVILDCKIPIIKAKHKPTDIDCDLSFTYGLGVENTALIKNYCDKSAECRELIIFIKRWMNHCELSGVNGINSYGISWLVIYFLQTKKILPTVNQLIEMNDKSQMIAGWETGVSKDFQVQTFSGSFKELLNGFFKFYGDFDYRHDVICPLLGRIVKKIDFQQPDELPFAMRPYMNYLSDADNVKPFRIDSIMCLQDPFDLAHNITKAVEKFKIHKFRTFCCYSKKIIDNNV